MIPHLAATVVLGGLLAALAARPGQAAQPEVDPFEATAEMEVFAREATRGCSEPQTRLTCLQRALVDPSFGFDYTASDTLTAAEAFRDRRGNCFSFTALFVSLARAAGLRAEMVRVPQVREVDREGSLVVVVRHLAVAAWDGASTTVVDFGGLDRDDDRPYAVVDTRAAGAIYHNNRGAQALRDGDVETAIERLASAVNLAPDWAEARVNLGVALRRRGDSRGAYDAYRDALRLDPGNPSALANLAVLYGAEDRPDEQADALRSLSGSRVTVYALLALAQVEMAAGNLPAARHALRRAWWRDPGLFEVHEALATWHLRAGHPRTAHRHERRAGRAWKREADPRSGSAPSETRPPPSSPPAR